MNNKQQMKNMLEGYVAKHGVHVNVEDSIKNLSYNDDEKHYLCQRDYKGIDLDCITRKCYRKVLRPDSKTENDSVKSADCLLISNGNIWYFVEFKDSKLNNKGAVKKDISIKAYSSITELMDILYETKDESFMYKDFLYDSPIEFFRKNVNYILVYSSVKNPMYYSSEKNYRLMNKSYLPEFVDKLKDYLFHDVCAMSELTFENEFLEKMQEDD